MNEEQFRQRAREQGYGDVQAKSYDPNKDGPLHTHEFSVMLLVVEGQFSLAFEDGTKSYLPGEVCELAANVMHAERAGSSGAKVLLAKRQASTSAIAGHR